ncbi:MAG: N-acetylmuramoyl-L-alanine amidase [Tenacibaculum sp.]
MTILKLSKYIFNKSTYIFFIFISFLCFTAKLNAQKKYVVVLDAGHGGKDYGASRGKYTEKKIALNLALKTGEILKNEKDIRVFYTRKKDVFVELHNRARIANEKNADLFVSIHCNANMLSKPQGAETYVLGLKGNKDNLEIVKKENEVILLEDNYESNYDYDPNAPETVIALSVLQEENLDNSLAFGALVQKNFKQIKRIDRKVKQANFLVLRETVMPSVLIELGFISNQTEGKFLNSKSGQQKMAKAIATAIAQYIKQIKLNTVNELYVELNKKKTQVNTSKKLPVAANTKKQHSKSSKTTKTSNTKPNTSVNKHKKGLEDKKQTADKTEQISKTKVSKTNIDKGIRFRVQLAAFKNKLSSDKFVLKKLTDVELIFTGGYYKYFYGNTLDFQEVKRKQTKARQAGYFDAFIVAFKDGKKISIKEALSSE